MRFNVLVKFAKILMVSRLRSTRRSFISRGITSRPLLVLLIGVILFVAGLILGIATVFFFTSAGASSVDVNQIVLTVFGGIPIFLIGFYFTMGLLWELNASSESESTDIINWLPISPSEYVFASSISTIYTYSPLVMVSIGYTLPIGFLTGNLLALSLLIPVTLLAASIGSVSVEILRSMLARASTAFTRLGGRTVILFRIFGVILILLFTQLLFNGFLLVRIISSLVGTVAAAAAIPIFWPTLSVTHLLGADPLGSAGFLSLSIGFFLALAYLSLHLRARFWVTSPPSLRFSSSAAISGVSKFRKFGLSTASIALVKREIRSATRRKEIVRLIAIPIILPVMVSFPVIFSPAPTSGTGPSQINPIFLAGPLLFGVGLGVLFLGMTSIGQEGRRLWNLSSLPVSAAVIVRSKILFTTIIGTVGLVLGLAVTVLFFHLSILDALVFLGLGVTVVLAEASLGVAVGSRYADFSEGPRPRFVTVIGSIIGSILGIIEMLLMSSPIVLFGVLRILFGVPFSLPLSLLVTGLLGLLFSWIGYEASVHPAESILSEPPN